jgi:transcriptional regulator with XRE-family HTH domain
MNNNYLKKLVLSIKIEFISSNRELRRQLVYDGKRLEELRKEKGTSQKEMGKIFGMSGTAIRSYEKSDRKMHSEILLKYADFFNVTIDYLLYRTNNKALFDEKNICFKVDEELSDSDMNLLRGMLEQLVERLK